MRKLETSTKLLSSRCQSSVNEERPDFSTNSAESRRSRPVFPHAPLFTHKNITRRPFFKYKRAHGLSSVPHSWTHMCGTTIFHFYACFTHEHPRRFIPCCIFFTRYLSVSEGQHKMLFVPCLFVVLRGSEGPASIQHPALLLVHNAAFYNRGKGQAFKDQTHLLIYSVYGISGLW